ncbi:MAG: UDP-3-O-(3-hydroxymyristoyl)glucosamine N-acyltransferase [Bacteroidota bacterium]
MVKDIANLVGGIVDGDPQIKINRPSRIDEAGGSGSISFYGNPKYEPFVYTTEASALLVPKSFEPKTPIQATLIKVEDVYAAIAILLESFGQKASQPATVSDKATIHPSAKIGESVSVGAFSSVGAKTTIGDQSILHDQVFIGDNVTIGKNVTLYPGVKVMADCIIGDHCTLHANVVVGSDGFGFAPQKDGSFKKIPQLGNVVIEDQVEIGSNCTIDRGSIGATLIKRGVKLDNLIQIAHNVEIGENTVIAAQTGIAGSTKIGKNCLIGGQVGFVGHIQIADGTRIQAQSGIMSSVTQPNTALFGSPAIAYRDYLKAYAIFKRLPLLNQKLKQLERLISKKDNSDK